MDELKDSVVLVIGASSGMGAAIAQKSAMNGAHVIGTGASEATASGIADTIPGAVGRVLDMSDADLVAALVADLDRVDHLVIPGQARGAAKTIAPLAEVDFDGIRGIFDVKFFGMLTLVQALLPKLSEQASITLFSGAASRRTIPGHIGLGGLNGAIEAAGRQMAKELAPRRVNVISPGLVRTPAYDALPAEQREAMFAAREKALPVGRIGHPDDIAKAVLHIMTNTYVTGTVMDIDGGGQLT